MVQGGSLLHQGTDEVVGDCVHGDLLANHGGSLAAEHVHAEGAFDVAEEQLRGPAAEIELGDLVGRAGNRIEEGGDHDDRLGSEAGA